MAIGTVKFFNAAKGFGFIVPEDGGNDIFVHTSAAESAGVPPLTKDQRLSFEIEEDAKGAVKACKLILIPDDNALVGATKDLSASPNKDRQAQRSQNRTQRPEMSRDATPTLRQANSNGSYRKSKAPDNTHEWQRNYARYCDLAQNTNDDAVARENYWQHAEHFLRMINGSST
jgi:cold shock protein